ncbi:hypothetical protein FB451DRAFT_1361897 [Mycena latifolia]|nr:hypothetical protein FB451DRAFT_1361897 [Mycena latifolia]
MSLYPRVLFAGVINTSVNTCWTIIHLGDKPEWKGKVAEEVRALLFTHGNSSESIHLRFSSVPLNAWEEEMPVLDAVIKETMRSRCQDSPAKEILAGDMLIAQKNHSRQGSISPTPWETYILTDRYILIPFRSTLRGSLKGGKIKPRYLSHSLDGVPAATLRGNAGSQARNQVDHRPFLTKFDYSLWMPLGTSLRLFLSRTKYILNAFFPRKSRSSIFRRFTRTLREHRHTKVSLPVRVQSLRRAAVVVDNF